MWKNSHIHLMLDTEFLNRLKKEAQEAGIHVSELCRRKLKGVPQLSRIEGLLVEINERLKNSTKFKQEVQNGNKIA